MHAALSHQRQAQVKAVHQKALSPADPAPQVHAARKRRMHHQALERRAAPRLVGGPLLVKLLQPLDRAQLRGIALEPAAFKRLVVETDDRQGLRAAPQFTGGLRGAGAHQMLSARLSTASAASFIASESDGCAWQIMPMSSLLARNSMATTASAISSEANAPMMCTPSITSVFASATNFTRPLVSPSARARALAMNGKVPARYSIPSAFSCCSVFPTQAISGVV